MRFTVADVFAGCGGLSHGFARTGLYRVVLGTDIDPGALRTFAHTHARHGPAPVLIEGDIAGLAPTEVVAQLAPLGLDARGSVDVVVGGPPCEGFSQNRRHEIVTPSGERVFTRNPLDSRDPRNHLFRYFLDLVDVMRPRAVLIENVPQMVTSHGGATVAEVQKTLGRLGYRTSWRVLNAAAYGVPQARRRAFVVATARDAAPFGWPEPTHGPAGECDADGQPLRPWVTVADAIGDLPPATDHETGRGDLADYGEARSDYARDLRSAWATPMNHVRRVPGDRVLARLRAMRPGMIADDLPAPLRTKSSYYNAYGRLRWDQPAKTITKSCNYLGSGCFGHPVEDRGITMREAARLQSFDDDFEFLSPSEPHIAKLVGSAVPPLLARVLATELAKVLDS